MRKTQISRFFLMIAAFFCLALLLTQCTSDNHSSDLIGSSLQSSVVESSDTTTDLVDSAELGETTDPNDTGEEISEMEFVEEIEIDISNSQAGVGG